MVETKSDPNCAEPICKSKVDMFKSFMGGPKAGAGKSSSTKAKASGNAPLEPIAQELGPGDCPLDREELGRATWGVLHSMGAYFPEKPTKEYQDKAKTFVQTLALMYPCVHCAEDFQNEVKKSPPRVDSRTSFSQWLCEQHNIVNKKLGKSEFDCAIKNLDERWRTGRAACWGEDADPEAISATLGRDE